MTKTTPGKDIETNEPHWIEWVTGALSAAVVLIVIIWIAKDALTDRDVAPDLHGAVLQIDARSEGFQVLFEIQNSSSQTASQVTVRAELSDSSKPVEVAETIFDYVPGHSKSKGGIIFQNNPYGKAISIRATSFNEP
jgi:uncharacterized protein (TIGR02588 family)